MLTTIKRGTFIFLRGLVGCVLCIHRKVFNYAQSKQLLFFFMFYDKSIETLCLHFEMLVIHHTQVVKHEKYVSLVAVTLFFFHFQ